jgi:FtsP/CotA-like multicopper oxidase with cupredoxin domain
MSGLARSRAVVVALAVLGVGVAACGGARSFAAELAQNAPGERVFELRVAGGKLVAGDRIIRVKQNETVRLRWTVAEPTVLHVHGYNVEQRAEPDQVAEMTFKAYATGRFPVYAHAPGAAAGSHSHQGAPLVSIEIYPR